MTVAEFVAYARKAVTAGVSGGLAAVAVAVQDGAVTQAEWWTVAGAVLAAAGLVYQVPNRVKE